jgi:hypothetical protein
VVPFGFIDDASETIAQIESKELMKDVNWQIPYEMEYYDR